jgi:hypothetical protein
VRFPDTDFAGLARAIGLEAATVSEMADLEVVRDWQNRGRPKPLLLDAKVLPTVIAEWLEEAFKVTEPRRDRLRCHTSIQQRPR